MLCYPINIVVYEKCCVITKMVKFDLSVWVFYNSNAVVSCWSIRGQSQSLLQTHTHTHSFNLLLPFSGSCHSPFLFASPLLTSTKGKQQATNISHCFLNYSAQNGNNKNFLPVVICPKTNSMHTHMGSSRGRSPTLCCRSRAWQLGSLATSTCKLTQ